MEGEGDVFEAISGGGSEAADSSGGGDERYLGARSPTRPASRKISPRSNASST